MKLVMSVLGENCPSCAYRLTVAKPPTQLAVRVVPKVIVCEPHAAFTTLTMPGGTSFVLGQVGTPAVFVKSMASHEMVELFQICSTWNWTEVPV
jgi:hypothetical protein